MCSHCCISIDFSLVNLNLSQVGHAGTLDPMATGLLIVCVGKATKLVDRYPKMGISASIDREDLMILFL